MVERDRGEHDGVHDIAGAQAQFTAAIGADSGYTEAYFKRAWTPESFGTSDENNPDNKKYADGRA